MAYEPAATLDLNAIDEAGEWNKIRTEVPMVRVRYIGVMFPESEFSKLREAYRHLRELQGKCRPMGDDYLALDAALRALMEAAAHFTKDPYFYGGRPH